MARVFNVTGACNPEKHYMVNIDGKLAEIKALVDSGAYFTINRARQYGKTTTIKALKRGLSGQYVVVGLDFQFLSHANFKSEEAFVRAFSRELLEAADEGMFSEAVRERLKRIKNAKSGTADLGELFGTLKLWCTHSAKPVVLMIDEVDSATNNEVFLDFLAQLRGYYINREEGNTFHSVILAGVYDVKNIKRKLRPEDEHKVNSPWNIATDFNVDMSFSKDGIKGMLKDYEADHHTGMDTERMAGLVYDYTSGYPFLVSRYCQLIDERVAGTEVFPTKEVAWTKEGFLAAERIMLSEKNTLFESMINKLVDYPELNDMLHAIVFNGKSFTYQINNRICELGTMFGFLKNDNGRVVVSNRTFHTILCDYFMSLAQLKDISYQAGCLDKPQFVTDGMLDMDLVLRKFVEHFHDVYGEKDQTFVEEYGRKFFLLYLKPIINGTGNYYVEAQTADLKRTDVIVDYLGKQFVVEMKIWNGPKYHEEGEAQLSGYLERLHLDKGYLLTFDFSKNKKIGVLEKRYGNKVLIEATV